MGLYGKKKGKVFKDSSLSCGMVTMLSEGTAIDGNLKLSGDVRIDGIITGNVSGNNRVVIGEKGEVKGDVACEFLELHGRVQGNVKSKEGARLHATAILEGDLHAPQFSVDMGAKFIGACKGQEQMPLEYSNEKKSKK